jgi:hypothetical protein
MYFKKNIIKAGCDTFNSFHSPVIVHRKHKGAVTRHEFLPSSARKHLQLLGGGCCSPDPLLTGSFFLATPLMAIS